MATPERIDLARELHDGIAQDLVAIGYSLDLLLADSSLSQQTRSGLRASRLQVDDLMNKVRDEIFHLRRNSHLMISAEVKDLIETEYSDFSVELDLVDVSTSPELSREIMAIIREALRNIRAHARATRIGITIYPINNRICLQICDNGIGGATMKNGRWGITGLTERVEALGGSISIENNFYNNGGVRITALL
ncbi:MAG: hypothetical protein RL130_1501 [Actinomycetota bacterium]|jgi:signal transduction histidine kinase